MFVGQCGTDIDMKVVELGRRWWVYRVCEYTYDTI